VRPALAPLGALLLGAALSLAAAPAAAQNHPELQWQVIESERFRILYHEGLDKVAQRAARILEEVHGPLSDLYGYEPPGPVRVILKDYDDYANGAAYFYHDAIEIWTSPLEHDFELRGTSDWLRNVLTHEYTHIISLGAARKGSPRAPAAFLEYFGYKEEKNRPDVLTGAPDRLVIYPLANTVIPMWLAEGVAQNMADGIHFDHWDTHRDMILRVATLNDELLPYERMGVFGKAGFGNEFVYDHGYGLTLYIARRFGQQALAEICRHTGSWTSLDSDGAIERATGVPARQLWTEWTESLQQRYRAQKASLGELRPGSPVVDEGFSNQRPAYAPQGDRLAYLSTGKQDGGPHHLVVRDLATGEDEVVSRVVSSTVSWHPGGRHLALVHKRAADKYGSVRADLYELDLDAPGRGWARQLLWAAPALTGVHYPEPAGERQLTRGLRAQYPAYSPDGKYLAFVQLTGTSARLGVLDLAEARQRELGPEDARWLVRFDDGSQVYTPAWSPDGRGLAYSYSRAGQRDIGWVEFAARDGAVSGEPGAPSDGAGRVEAGGGVPWVATPGTDRDPVFAADGGELVFASDVSGIFNVYALDLESGSVEQITNLVGGALNPTVGADGQVAFAAYDVQGYEIRAIDRGRAAAVTDGRFAAVPAAIPSGGDARTGLVRTGMAPSGRVPYGPTRDMATGDVRIRSRPETASPPLAAATGADLPAQPYGVEFLRTTLMPRLLYDEGHAKAGFYLGSEDALQRQSLYGGASLAPGNGDRDVYAAYVYRGWRPTVELSFIHMKRHSSRGDSSEARDLIVTGMNFSLSRMSASVSHRLNRASSLELAATYDRYDASLESDVFVPRTDGQPGFERRSQKPFGYTYLNGFDLSLTYRHDSIARRRDRTINPRSGRHVLFRYDRMFNYFIKGFDETNTSFLDETYLNLFYNQVAVDWREYVALPGSSALGLRLYGGWIDSDEVDGEQVNDFFDFHLGGISHMKGYTYYSVEGRKAAMAQATWRVPLLPDVGRSLANVYFDKVYAGAYASLGKAWDRKVGERDPIFNRKGPLRDVGGQLRLDLISFYSMPTRIQIDAAYGVDEVGSQGPWKFYLTVLFNYIDHLN